jgi:predicted glycosyltransferase
MQEAKYSVNVKFNLQGFDTQLTLREDEKLDELLKKFRVAIDYLEKVGATPE